jgi:hypothetical protein
MSRNKMNGQAERAMDRARQAAARVKPVAAQVKPLATSTRETARRGVHRTRAWAAPQVERTGHILQENVAPKVSAMMSSAAKRIEPVDPAKPRRRRWRKVVGSAAATLAASAAAVVVRNRLKALNGDSSDTSEANGQDPDQQ